MKLFRTTNLHWTVGLAAGLVALGAAVRLAVLWWSHSYNVAAEANGLYGLLEVADGKTLYPPLSQRPLFIYLYTPLHAWLGGWSLRLLGISELRTQVLGVRLFSLVCFLAALGLTTHMARRWFKVSAVALAAALLLAISKFTDYATSTRHDMFYCLLELCSLYCFVRFVSDKKKWGYFFFLVFASAALWTRQTGIITLGAALFWLAWERRWALALRTGFIFGAFNFFLGLILYRHTGGTVLEHVLYSNVRGFRPILSVVWDNSFLSFCVSYLFFALLVILGVRRFGLGEVRREIRLVLTSLFIALVVSGAMFLRAGGDVNYFFLGLLLGVPLAALAAEALMRSHPRLFHFSFFAQTLVITAVLGAKSYSAFQVGELPYEAAAARIRQEIPVHGLLLGKYAQSLGIHLRGWAIHGPDVTNAGSIAANGHPILREIEEELFYSMKRGEVSAVVVADPRCRGGHWLVADWAQRYGSEVVLEPWLCAFFRKDLETSPAKTALLTSPP